MYEHDLSEILEKYGGCDIITYMFYSEPGHRDLIILKQGIEDVYTGEYFINIKQIDEDMARTYASHRGWLIDFMFVKDIKETKMAEWLSQGLEELRVKHELVGVREIVHHV